MKFSIIMLFCLLVFIIGCSQTESLPPEVKLYEQDIINVNLNGKFWLVENQTASIEAENLQLTLRKIGYAPCSRWQKCINSGVSALIEVSKDDETKLISLNYGGGLREGVLGYHISLLGGGKHYMGFHIRKK